MLEAVVRRAGGGVHLVGHSFGGLVALAVPNRWVVIGILVLAFLTGCAQAFGGPAYQALVPALVHRKDLANAIALNSIMFNTARLVGPAIAGLLVAAVGEGWCFFINGVSYIPVIVCLTLVKAGQRLLYQDTAVV